MTKVFLSHSSAQKGFVREIAKKLSKQDIVYDEYTFEEGEKTISEIFIGIEQTCLFVLFISDESLNSSWVKSEIKEAKEKLDSNSLLRIYPVIIDKNINYDDPRIPDWLKEEYNLKYVSKPTKISNRISSQLKMLNWNQYPKNQKRSNIFVGRTSQIPSYEERIFNFDKPKPIVFIATGLPSIGRRKFTNHCLTKTNIVTIEYSPVTLVTNYRDSIENFIIGLYDLGFSDVSRSELTNFLKMEMNKKVELATTLLLEIEEHEKLLSIVDNFSIVKEDGFLVEWFTQIINKIEHINRLFISLISRRRVKFKEISRNNRIFAIAIPELKVNERKTLFQIYLELEQIKISRADFETIASLFTGFPEQIHFAVTLLKNEGLPYVKNHLHEIVSYNATKVDYLVQQFEKEEFTMQILTFICNQEFVSLALLIEIFNDNAETFDTIERLFDQMLIEFTTSNKEYIRANDAIKDYVQRLGLKLDSSHENKFRDHVLHSMSDYNTLERDLSDYYISTTYALKNGLEVPNELLIPSHFLNAMKSLYNNEKRFNDVVTLADRVLPHSPFLDSRIIHEVRFWLCQALARLRDRRMLKEVQKVSGPDHNLLLGFYYRMVGQLEKAKAKFHTLLEEHPNMRRAKRELVQVHLNLEEFEEARELAEENYRADKNNVYNLQNYFRCIIKDENSKDFEKTEVLQKLLIELNENRHDKARGMFLESSAWYEYYMMNQYSEAIGKIDSAIEEFPDSIYFYLQRIEITRKENDLYELKESLTMYDNNFHDNKNTGNKLSYLKGLIYLKTKSGKKFQAKQMLDEELRGKYSASVITKIEREVGL